MVQRNFRQGRNNCGMKIIRIYLCTVQTTMLANPNGILFLLLEVHSRRPLQNSTTIVATVHFPVQYSQSNKEKGNSLFFIKKMTSCFHECHSERFISVFAVCAYVCVCACLCVCVCVCVCACIMGLLLKNVFTEEASLIPVKSKGICLL